MEPEAPLNYWESLSSFMDQIGEAAWSPETASSGSAEAPNQFIPLSSFADASAHTSRQPSSTYFPLVDFDDQFEVQNFLRPENPTVIEDHPTNEQDLLQQSIHEHLLRRYTFDSARLETDSRSPENISDSKDKESLSMTKRVRRRIQNRAAQRAFRERKDQSARNLEAKVISLEYQKRELESVAFQLTGEMGHMKDQIRTLNAELEILRRAGFTEGCGLD